MADELLVYTLFAAINLHMLSAPNINQAQSIQKDQVISRTKFHIRNVETEGDKNVHLPSASS